MISEKLSLYIKFLFTKTFFYYKKNSANAFYLKLILITHVWYCM